MRRVVINTTAGSALRAGLPGSPLPIGIAVPVVAAVVLVTLLLAPGLNPAHPLPLPHFLVVTGVSLTAFAIALIMVLTAARAQHYKLLLLALGFMAMAGLFAVHGLTTPGILLPLTGEYDNPSMGSMAASAGYLSLAVPAALFAIGYTPLLAAYERRVPFWPAGGLLLMVVAGLCGFAVLSVSQQDFIADLPMTHPPVSYVLATLSAGCLLFAGTRQYRAFSREQLPFQGALALAFPLLALAQVAMVVSPPWTPAWWEYHALMLIAVALALRALALERVRGASLRVILEAALDLEVRADLEIEHVAEIATLAAAIEAKDRDTRGHTARVAELTVLIARELGMSAPSLRYLARAGLLHDIGKLQIPDEILTKPGPLTPEEWVVMKRHPELGVAILTRMGKFEDEANVVMSHHERMDGSGYPEGLVGDAIPLGARILAVADTYDVVVSDRPYRKARTREQALQIMLEERAVRLYAPAVDALLEIVRLQNDSDRRQVPRLRQRSPERRHFTEPVRTASPLVHIVGLK